MNPSIDEFFSSKNQIYYAHQVLSQLLIIRGQGQKVPFITVTDNNFNLIHNFELKNMEVPPWVTKAINELQLN